MFARMQAIGFGALTLAVLLLGAEASARVDDWLHQDTPVLANPNRERALTVHDEHGMHGRPGGSFRKWKLNAFGFRTPEQMDKTPPTGKTRLMFLGASETFGLRESEGKEYPAQLSEQLRRDGVNDIEVVNAAMAGITIKSQVPYWEKWASQVRPQVVFIYPSPMLYLDDEPPRAPQGAAPAAPQESVFASRFAERVNDALGRNPLIRKVRLDWVLRSQASGKSVAWFYQDAPPDRLKLFLDDLAALLDAVRARGARPVLLTHAIKAGSPIRAEDQEDVREFRRFASRATENAIVAFEDAANAGLKRLATEQGVLVVDIATHMNGRRAWFGDLVHFNDAGAAEMAHLLAEAIEDPQHGLRTRPAPGDGAR